MQGDICSAYTVGGILHTVCVYAKEEDAVSLFGCTVHCAFSMINCDAEKFQHHDEYLLSTYVQHSIVTLPKTSVAKEKCCSM